MSQQDVHARLADLAAPAASDHVVDLGCGPGATLHELAERSPGSTLTGIDTSPDALAELAATLPRAHRIRHNLTRPLPVADGSIDIVVCHNTLEYLPEPAALLTETARILRPGGRAVLAHTDFETLVVTTADRDLTRRILLTYAELAVPYRNMAATDPQTGRRLPGLVRRSPLHLDTIHAHTTVLPTLAEARTARLTEVAGSARRSAARHLGHVTTTDVDRWEQQLDYAQETGDFLFSETTYIVTATHR